MESPKQLNRVFYYATPNNPYYGLGPVKGSVCDSLRVGQPQLQYHNFDLRAAPNPVLHGQVRFYFELPQVRSGTLSLYNTLGQEVASYYVAPGSGILSATLPPGTASGIYTAIIRSQGYQKAIPIAVVNQEQ